MFRSSELYVEGFSKKDPHYVEDRKMYYANFDESILGIKIDDDIIIKLQFLDTTMIRDRVKTITLRVDEFNNPIDVKYYLYDHHSIDVHYTREELLSVYEMRNEKLDELI